MKALTLSLTTLLCFAIFTISCKKTEETTPTGNQQPAIPGSPTPSDAGINISITPVLSWTCSDPDAGDSLKYDIYFGTLNPPNTLLVSNWKQPNYALSTLEYNKTYYWRVTAHDLKGASAVGPIWRFSTIPDLPTLGLIAYFPFNGNANDESGNGNNGTVNGATLTTDRFGNANKAYSFNGINNYIQCPDPLTTSTFTIAVWIYVDDNTNIRKEIINGGRFDITSGGYHLYRDNLFGRFDLSNIPGPQSNSILPSEQWTFFVGISYGNKLELYINGVLNDQSSDNANLVKDKLFIGTDAPHNSSSYWKGRIDDIRIYNRSLTNSEVLQLYHESGWSK